MATFFFGPPLPFRSPLESGPSRSAAFLFRLSSWQKRQSAATYRAAFRTQYRWFSWSFPLFLLRKQVAQPDLAYFSVAFNQEDEYRQQNQQVLNKGEDGLHSVKVQTAQFYQARRLLGYIPLFVDAPIIPAVQTILALVADGEMTTPIFAQLTILIRDIQKPFQQPGSRLFVQRWSPGAADAWESEV